MGLFIKSKKNLERNEIDNPELKENLANTAISTLRQSEDYVDHKKIQYEFGYLYMIEGHGVEALFKVITDTAIAYFAAQGDKMMRLNFNDELFQITTMSFLSLHN